MAATSILDEAGELEDQAKRLFAQHDVPGLPYAQQELVRTIIHQLVDVRLDMRDYEYAQTRAEQLEYVVEARPRLEQLRKNILKASEYDLLGAVDTAMVTVRVEQLLTHLT